MKSAAGLYVSFLTGAPYYRVACDSDEEAHVLLADLCDRTETIAVPTGMDQAIEEHSPDKNIVPLLSMDLILVRPDGSRQLVLTAVLRLSPKPPIMKPGEHRASS